MAKKTNLIGAWAFLIGVILAIIFAFIGAEIWLTWLFFALGIVIGLLNITDTEIKPFLFAGTVLVIISALSGNVFSGLAYVSSFLANLMAIFVPATIIVALKSVFSLSKA